MRTSPEDLSPFKVRTLPCCLVSRTRGVPLHVGEQGSAVLPLIGEVYCSPAVSHGRGPQLPEVLRSSRWEVLSRERSSPEHNGDNKAVLISVLDELGGLEASSAASATS